MSTHVHIFSYVCNMVLVLKCLCFDNIENVRFFIKCINVLSHKVIEDLELLGGAKLTQLFFHAYYFMLIISLSL